MKKKHSTIDLNDVETGLKTRADKITFDFFTLAKTDNGLHEFRKKDYITPLVHRSLIEPKSPYSWAPWIIESTLR